MWEHHTLTYSTSAVFPVRPRCIYCNGVQQMCVQASSHYTGSAKTMTIGGGFLDSTPTKCSNLQGALDQFRIWARALSAASVLLLILTTTLKEIILVVLRHSKPSQHTPCFGMSLMTYNLA
jgi:hypothetical protein